MKCCGVCGSIFTYKLIDKIEYYYCNTCELLLKNEKHLLISKMEKERYLNHKYDNNYYEYILKIYEEIRPLIIGKCILDYGCGQEDVLSKVLNSKGFECFSYDKYFKICEYENRKYDTIILIEVIEHIYEVFEKLNELKDLLNKGGRLIIKTKLHDNNFKNWWYLRDSTHISFMSKITIDKICDKLSLKKVWVNSNLIVLEA